MKVRLFAYCRVSTTGQDTEGQIAEIAAAGFNIESQRAVAEQVSGSVAARLRKGFAKLLDRLEGGDVLVVTKLDRLGRDVIDVCQTVQDLQQRGVRVHCLQLGGMDLTSSSGAMVMGVMASVAQFERALILERTDAGRKLAKAKGVKFGRKSALTEAQQAQANELLAAGQTVSGVALQFKTSRKTIQRVKAKYEDIVSL
ncbi:recombinase family protein [Aquabacterium sp.]|uniref:recombinase family protein n=1 Tax=Aquabacterium sp. TaxID=1872578 RepID=UPI00248A20BA|nr:recombinase family protein [Aquabacterium sp.]MDI1259367.1 recombinase family protein [Aquabacterium sp.]